MNIHFGMTGFTAFPAQNKGLPPTSRKNSVELQFSGRHRDKAVERAVALRDWAAGTPPGQWLAVWHANARDSRTRDDLLVLEKLDRLCYAPGDPPLAAKLLMHSFGDEQKFTGAEIRLLVENNLGGNPSLDRAYYPSVIKRLPGSASAPAFTEFLAKLHGWQLTALFQSAEGKVAIEELLKLYEAQAEGSDYHPERGMDLLRRTLPRFEVAFDPRSREGARKFYDLLAAEAAKALHDYLSKEFPGLGKIGDVRGTTHGLLTRTADKIPFLSRNTVLNPAVLEVAHAIFRLTGDQDNPVVLRQPAGEQ